MVAISYAHTAHTHTHTHATTKTHTHTPTQNVSLSSLTRDGRAGYMKRCPPVFTALVRTHCGSVHRISELLFFFLYSQSFSSFSAATPHDERIRVVNELSSQGPETVCTASFYPTFHNTGPFEFIEPEAEFSHTDPTHFDVVACSHPPCDERG